MSKYTDVVEQGYFIMLLSVRRCSPVHPAAVCSVWSVICSSMKPCIPVPAASTTMATIGAPEAVRHCSIHSSF